MYKTMHELFSNYNVVYNYIPCVYSTFIANNGNDGGAVSTAYLPLSFRGSNTFEENRGHSFEVCIESHLVKTVGRLAECMFLRFLTPTDGILVHVLHLRFWCHPTH